VTGLVAEKHIVARHELEYHLSALAWRDVLDFPDFSELLLGYPSLANGKHTIGEIRFQDDKFVSQFVIRSIMDIKRHWPRFHISGAELNCVR
jgi:hypothetical protein